MDDAVYKGRTELPDLFRHSGQATASSTDNLITITSPHEPVSIVLDCILYSRRFVGSYNLVLLAVLLVLTARNWILKNALLSNRRHHFSSHEGPCGLDDNHGHEDHEPRNVKQTDVAVQTTVSSSCSASDRSNGSSDLGDKPSATEASPLLRHRRSKKGTAWRRLRSQVKGYLIYQPRDIPIVRKQLPSNLTSLTILIWFALNLFYCFYRIPFNLERTEYIMADRAGLLFAANLPILYACGAKTSPIRRLTGFSYENLNIFHRRLGEWLALLAIIHAGLMLLVWYRVLYPIGFTFWQLLGRDLIWLGLAAFFCYEILYMTSLSSFRQAFYEIFLASHIVLQFLALIFLFLHHFGSRPYCLAAAAIFTIDRIVYRHVRNRWSAKADLMVMPDRETVRLSIINDRSSPTKLPPWKPSEHVFLSIPVLSKGHILQSHPFTIASPAPGGEGENDDNVPDAEMDFIIRARDGFSATLLRMALDGERPSSIPIAVDGPYGGHHALEMLQGARTAILVAGGSGIAVTLPLAWALGPHRPVGAEHGSLASRVVLVWVVHDERHVEWVPKERMDALVARGVEVVVPPPTNKAGRPNIAEILGSLVNGSGAGDRVGVVVSGPDGMNREVRNDCAAMVWQGHNIDVAVEKFGW